MKTSAEVRENEETAAAMLIRLGMDGKLWAEELIKTHSGKVIGQEFDHGDALGWFANAIMAGYDEGRRRGESDMSNNPRVMGLLEAAKYLHNKAYIAANNEKLSPKDMMKFVVAVNKMGAALVAWEVKP